MINSFRFLIITLLIRLIQAYKSAVAIAKGQISYYPQSVRCFEALFAESLGSKHAMMFSNATSAIEAALFAVGVGQDDVVGTTAFVIPSSYCSASCLGAKIAFYDIDASTLNLDIDQLKNDTKTKLKALIVTHFYGNPCDMEEIMSWAKEHNVFVIEDCSHAHGASFKGKPLGSWGHVGVFSLQGAKAVAAGEGGIAVTNETNLALTMAAYGHQESYKKFKIGDEKSLAVLPPFGYGRKMRAHPLGAILANVDLQFLSLKNKIYANWVKELSVLSVKLGTFTLPAVSEGGIQAGYCQGIPIIFANKCMADEFVNISSVSRINCFRRSYQDSIQYYADSDNKAVLEQLSVSIKSFDSVVFLPFYQFISPFRWFKLFKILKSMRPSSSSVLSEEQH
jgi:dTDP-4-amino-4,6-dideoxygalactose transaminase